MIAFLIVIYALFGIYMILNFKHDFQMLQQNSYRIPRYWRYLKKNDIGSAWRLTDVAVLFIVFSRLVPPAFSALLVGMLAVSKIWLISNQKFKKPLVFTKRVTRLYSVASAIAVGLALWAIFMLGFKAEVDGFYSGIVITLGILLGITIFSWVIVFLALILLIPVEKSINRKYYNEAKHILNSMHDLVVVGITGSYGKTSTKHYLERILAEKFEVLMTPGSFNTTLGVIRTVREQLKPFHEVFICEMGAKQRGDIKEICDLVNPKIGIVTAVGPMHLETFKTLENVGKTKFELVEAIPGEGVAVINDDSEYSHNRKVDGVKAIRYSVTDEDNSPNLKELYNISDIRYDSEGTSFTITSPDRETYQFNTKLVGECNISNLTAAIIVALQLGMSVGEIKKGINGIEQVEHRLSIKKTPGGLTIIDDAFNSNPSGSKMALQVLHEFNTGKRIIITPGMIELGERQYKENEIFGENIAKYADIAIIVGQYNREAICKGINKSDFDEDNLFIADTFNEAQNILNNLVQPGDVVLYENDLPDSFK